MKVASDFTRPALTSLYEVAGRFVLMDFEEQATSSALKSFLDRWQVSLVDSGQRGAQVNLRFAIGDLPGIPNGFEEFAVGDGNIGYATDTAYRISFPERALIAADESDTVRIWLKQPLDPESTLIPQLISHALSAALRRCGVFELHSGAVVSHSTRKAILICGPSGSGKSTLTLQLAGSGWSYLSDDVVLLSMDAGAVRATGLRRFFALTSQTVAKSGIPEVNAIFATALADNNRKLSFVPEDLFPAGLVDECRPNVILFPSITGDSESVTCALSPSETMSRLIRLCPWSCYDRAVARDFLDVLARLVKQSVSFDLLAGHDLMGDPSFTSSFLAGVLNERVL